MADLRNMTECRSDRRIFASRLARWVVGSSLVAVVVGLTMVTAPAPAANSCATTGGDIAIASSRSGPWFTGIAPPLTDQHRVLMQNLRPGSVATLTAYVKNLGSTTQVPTLSLRCLGEAGGAFTSAERQEQDIDRGELAENTLVDVTFASTARPADPPVVVASGTLAELASSGVVRFAPAAVRPYGKADELGIWRLVVRVPADVGNVVQGDRAWCGISFGLVRMK